MRYRTAVDFRTALETRLRAESVASGRSVQRLRRIVAFDRLLARLLVVAPDRWVLKGGLALDFRLGARTRFTRDMDLARMDDADAATEDMIAAQACDLGDFFVFAVQRTDRLDALADGAAVRYHLSAQLAGRVFEETVVDVGLGGPFTWTPQSLRCPDLLSFAGIAPLDVPVLPLDQHVAEKLHAYTRGYGDGTLLSTRVKDLIDLVLIAELARFDATALRAACWGRMVRYALASALRGVAFSDCKRAFSARSRASASAGVMVLSNHAGPQPRSPRSHATSLGNSTDLVEAPGWRHRRAATWLSAVESPRCPYP